MSRMLVPNEDEQSLIIDRMDYNSLKAYSLASKGSLQQVRTFFEGITRKMLLKWPFLASLKKQDIIERLYHVNGYQTGYLSGITVDENGNWIGPAGSITNTGQIVSWVNRHNQLHRVDGPAKTEKTRDGQLLEYWYMNGQLHRTDGPALIISDWNGVVAVAWYVNDRRQNRPMGPEATPYAEFADYDKTKWLSNRHYYDHDDYFSDSGDNYSDYER